MPYDKPEFKPQYENYIAGSWTPPVDGQYFDDISPVDNSFIARVPKSNARDIDLAVTAAWKAAGEWGKKSVMDRSELLLSIAARIEENMEKLAIVESWDNGKPVRETIAADIPLTVDHFRYFAGVIRAETGEVNDINATVVSMETHEPLGVVGLIIPWNFPILMAAWKIAPALATGNCVVLKPAEQTPVSILFLMQLIEDLLPPGVLNIVNGFGPEAGKPLASHPDIKKIAFTGETATGRLILQYASENIIPVTLELGGKSPNIFCQSVVEEDDTFLDKAVEGLVLFAFNQGEVCTCPSRALIHEDIYDDFIQRCLDRIESIVTGNVLDLKTMIGAQVSSDQYKKVLNYIKVGLKEGAELLTGGTAYENPVHANGYFIKPTVFKGNNSMRIFQEEIFGPVLSVTTFKDDDEALAIANDTFYGLGAGVWTRETHQMQHLSRGVEAGRVWCNCYHVYPAHASFGGYKKSGIGRETHKMMLNNYRHTKNILTSYDKKPMGLF